MDVLGLDKIAPNGPMSATQHEDEADGNVVRAVKGEYNPDTDTRPSPAGDNPRTEKWNSVFPVADVDPTAAASD